MRKRLLGTVAVATLVLAACGGDDSGGGPQSEVADMMIQVLNDASEVEGVEVNIDEDCIRDAVSKLSDEDAQKILDAGPDGEPDVSAEADAVGNSMFECVEIGDINLSEIDG